MDTDKSSASNAEVVLVVALAVLAVPCVLGVGFVGVYWWATRKVPVAPRPPVVAPAAPAPSPAVAPPITAE